MDGTTADRFSSWENDEGTLERCPIPIRDTWGHETEGNSLARVGVSC